MEISDIIVEIQKRIEGLEEILGDDVAKWERSPTRLGMLKGLDDLLKWIEQEGKVVEEEIDENIVRPLDPEIARPYLEKIKAVLGDIDYRKNC